MTAKTARISACGKYRYTLTRPARISNPSKPPAVLCMLNPSKASADIDDPTITRCWGFADRWGCDGLIVVNAYALRSTEPDNLWLHPDPVGPENNDVLREVAAEHKYIICAWGTKAKPDRIAQVIEIFSAAEAGLGCLGYTKDRHPKHPLYIRGDQVLIPFLPALDIQ